MSAAICAPHLYYITTFEVPLLTGLEGQHEVVLCATKRTLDNSGMADMAHFVLLFMIPLGVMSILYARIGAVIWKTSIALQFPMTMISASVVNRHLIQVQDERRGRVLQSRRAVIQMLIAFVTSFAVCNLPYHLRKVFQYYLPGYKVQGYFNQMFTPLTFLLMYTNCAINPILYAFMSETFRRSLREVMRSNLRCRCQRNDSSRTAQQRLSV